MKNFFQEFILNDPRAKSTDRVDDMGMLEPVTRLAVQGIIDEARQLGIELMIFETYRSKQRQKHLYSEGRTKLKNVGVHHYGLACDIVKKVNGKPSWDGSFDLLGKLAYKYGLIWGGDWGDPSVRHNFIDSVHVQRCSIIKQQELFAGNWYPSNNYNPYKDNNLMDAPILVAAEPTPEWDFVPVTINLAAHLNYEGERLEKLKNALRSMELVLNSEALKNRIIGYTTKGRKTFFYRKSLFGRYIDQPYTNEQIYNMIITAKEERGNVSASTIDLHLHLVNGSNGSVIGYGYPGSKEIYTYSIKFDRMSEEEVAGHITHEWCHKLGFEHSHERSPNRSHSVPYAVGYIVEELAHQMSHSLNMANQ